MSSYSTNALIALGVGLLLLLVDKFLIEGFTPLRALFNIIWTLSLITYFTLKLLEAIRQDKQPKNSISEEKVDDKIRDLPPQTKEE